MREVARFVNPCWRGCSPETSPGTGSPSARQGAGVRTDDTPKLRFSATVGRESEVEVALD